MALEKGVRLGPAIAWAVVAVAVVLAIPAFALYFVVSTLSSAAMCGNRIAQTLPSPDGKHRAVLFERDCGAMDGFSTQVSVLGPAQALPNEGGNALVSYPTGDGPRGPWGGPNLVMRWLSDDKLVLLRDPSTALSYAQGEVAGVKILLVVDHLPNRSN